MNINPFRFVRFARRFRRLDHARPLTRVGWRRRSLSLESLEQRSLLAIDAFSAALHNGAMPTDVNSDGHTTPIDALSVINELNQYGTISVAALSKQMLIASTAGAMTSMVTPLVASSNSPSSSAITSSPAAGNLLSDVNGDGVVSPLDALDVINQLNQVSNPTVQMTLEVTDTSGNPISTVQSGQAFQLREFVQDLRPDTGDNGVFSAYSNITYSAAQADVTGAVQFQPPYTSAMSSNTATDGSISAVGALDPSLTPIGTAKFPLFIVPMVAQATGTLTFTGAADTTAGHDVLVYGDNTAVPADQIDFGSASVQVVGPAVSIGDVTAAENAGTTQLQVTLSSASNVPVTVAFTTVDGAAKAGTNYQTASGTLTFNPGDPLSQTISITLLDDGKVTPSEAFSVQLSNPTNAAIDPNHGTGTVTETNVDVPVVSLAGKTVAENAGTVTLNATLDQSPLAPVTVVFNTHDGTAVNGTNYVAKTGTLTFQPGQQTQPITVTLVDDGKVTNDLSFSVALSNANGATVGATNGTATVVETNVDLPKISIDSTSVDEAAGSVQLHVTLDQAPINPLTVHFATADGTAAAGTDYTSNSGDLTFAPGGALTQTVTIGILNPGATSGSKAFSVQLSAATGGTIVPGGGAVTINDNDIAPTISIQNPPQFTTPTSGTAPLQFTASLSNAFSSQVTVAWATQDGSATAGIDYQAASGTLTFAPGQTTQTFNVDVIGDTVFKPNQDFFVTLSNPSGATLSTQTTATALLVSGVAPPVVSISAPAPVNPGTSGTAPLVFTLTLNGASTQPVIVHYQTQDGTATAAHNDYQPASGQLTFAAKPSQTQQTMQFAVNAVGTTINEPSQTFSLVLSNPSGGTLDTTASSATATILRNNPLPQLSISDPTPIADPLTGAPTNLVFTVTLSAPSGQPNGVSVNYSTQDGTAAAGSQYQTTSGTLTIPEGQTTGTISVPIIANSVAVGSQKTFTLALDSNSALNATVTQSTATGTILGVLPTISIGNVTAQESSPTATLSVSLDQSPPSAVTVVYSTVDGAGANGAKAGVNYKATSGTLTFAAGTTTLSQPISISLIDDGKVTPNLNFGVQVSNPSNATIDPNHGTATVTETNVDKPAISIGNVTVNETDGQATLNVTLSQAPVNPVTVAFATVDGNGPNAAKQGISYNAAQGTLTFQPGGSTTQTITVGLKDALLVSGNQQFAVLLGNPTNGTLNPTQSTGNVIINDNDPLPTLTISPPAPITTPDQTPTSTNMVPVAFTVALDHNRVLNQDITFNFKTFDATATAGVDYQPTAGTVTIKAGNTAVEVTVNVLANNGISADTRIFTAQISDPTNAIIPGGVESATATLLNDNPKASISGFVYVDANHNGVFNSNEQPLAGVTVTLTGFDAQNRPLPAITTITGPDGSYHFNNLNSAVYTITETPPSEFTSGIATAGSGGQLVGTGINQIQVIARSGNVLTSENFGEFINVGGITKKQFIGSNL